MKLPISKRLLCCASLVPDGARVADIGTDHGYLGIHLLLENRIPYVVAGDLREKPLQKAVENAQLYGVEDKMEFVLSDGLTNVDPEKIDTVVMAGMGGDLMGWILAACEWIKDEKYTLILQPQTDGQGLRRWLGQNHFCIERETLVKDGGFLYTVMRVRYGKPMQLSPGQQFASPWLLCSGSELVPDYLQRLSDSLQQTAAGIRRASCPDGEKLRYYEQAAEEIQEMMKNYVNCQTDT